MLDADTPHPPRPGRGSGVDGRAAGRRAVAAAAVVVALLGVAGCGDDEDDTAERAETPGGAVLTAEDARTADRAIKEGLVEIMASVESCFRGSRDYGACRARTQIGATTLAVVPDDPGVAEATISRATPTGYRILSVSLSGNRFAITKDGGRVIRSCAARSALGKSGGGCAGNGW